MSYPRDVIGGCSRRLKEIDRLQQLLDRSAAGAGEHLRGIVTDERRLSAAQLVERLPGMRLLAVATVTADGRPLAGPVDGYFLHGTFWFSSGRNSVRMRHLAARPAVSATHLPGEELAVTVHGRAELFELRDPARAELRQAMLDYYVPRQGPEFETWLDQAGRGRGAHRGREDVHLWELEVHGRLALAGRAVPVRRSASAHSRVAVAVSRARRGGRTVVVGPTSPNHLLGP